MDRKTWERKRNMIKIDKQIQILKILSDIIFRGPKIKILFLNMHTESRLIWIKTFSWNQLSRIYNRQKYNNNKEAKTEIDQWQNKKTWAEILIWLSEQQLGLVCVFLESRRNFIFIHIYCILFKEAARKQITLWSQNRWTDFIWGSFKENIHLMTLSLYEPTFTSYRTIL